MLDRIVELGLLEEKPAATISTYPQETQKRIVGECAAVFAENEHRKLPLNQALDTVNILSCGLSFGLEEIQLTGQIVTILSNWVLEPARILNDMSEAAEAELRDIILRGLSCLFREKQQSNKGDALIGELQSHVDYCRKVLNLFITLPTGNDSSTSVRILIGVCDYLLGKPLLPYCYLGDELADYLMGTLLEVLLKRQERSKELWECIGQRFGGWLNRLPVANCWSTAIVELTRAYVREEETARCVLELTWKGQNVEVVVQRDFVKQAWFRLAFFVQDLSRAFPSVVAKVVSAMGEVINGLLNLNPQANTLMALFGKPLTQVIFREDCPDAKANALSVLCQVMCRTRSDQVIRGEYLGLFYAAVRRLLKMEAMLTLGEGELFGSIMAVLHGEEILRLPGGRVLAGDFMVGCQRIVPRLQGKLSVQFEEADLRRTTFRLLSQLSVVSAHFDLPYHASIEGVLLESLQGEGSAENAVYLMNILTMHSAAHHQGPSERLAVVRGFIAKLEQAKISEVALIGTAVISCLRSLVTPSALGAEFEQLCTIGQGVLQRNDLAQDGKFLSSLLEFLVDHLYAMSGSEAHIVDFLAQAMGYQNQQKPRSNANESSGLGFLRNEATLEAHNRERALREFAEGQLCRMLHRRQRESGDEDWPAQKHYKLFSTSVLSVGVRERMVQLVIRNRAGRFVWYFDLAVPLEQNEGELLVIEEQEMAFENDVIESGEDVYNDQNVECSFPLDEAFSAATSSPANERDAVSVRYHHKMQQIDERELGKILLTKLGVMHILLGQRESLVQEDIILVDRIPRYK